MRKHSQGRDTQDIAALLRGSITMLNANALQHAARQWQGMGPVITWRAKPCVLGHRRAGTDQCKMSGGSDVYWKQSTHLEKQLGSLARAHAAQVCASAVPSLTAAALAEVAQAPALQVQELVAALRGHERQPHVARIPQLRPQRAVGRCHRACTRSVWPTPTCSPIL